MNPLRFRRFTTRVRSRLGDDRGFTILDILIGGVLLLGLIGVILKGAPVASNYVTQFRAEGQLNQLASNITNRYNNGSTYTGLTNALAVTESLFPAGMLDASGNASHAFHGVVTLGTDSTTGPVLATITFNSVPYQVCLQMINDGGALLVKTDQNATWEKPPFNLNSTPTDDTMCPAAALVENITWAYR